MTKDQKLERWAEREIERNLQYMIIDTEDGKYVVFGKYYLEIRNTGVSVSTWDREIHVFTNKRSALGWCVADKYRQYNLANNILLLDKKKQALLQDIYCRKNLGQRSQDSNFYEIVNTKIQNKISRCQGVSAELEKCINMTKYLQIRGFNNETA